MGTSARPTDRCVVVLAGNFNEFLWWCREHQKNPRDRRSVIFVDRPDRLQGLLDFDHVIYGTFWYRRDAHHIYDMLTVRIRAGKATRAARYEDDNVDLGLDRYPDSWERYGLPGRNGDGVQAER